MRVDASQATFTPAVFQFGSSWVAFFSHVADQNDVGKALLGSPVLKPSNSVENFSPEQLFQLLLLSTLG